MYLPRLPPIFESCKKHNCSFNSIPVSMNDSDDHQIFNVEFYGPFILLKLEEDEFPQMLIFTPNYLPQIEDDSISLKSVTYTDYSDVHLTFYFDHFDIMNKFQKTYFQSISSLQEKIKELSKKTMRGKCGEVVCLFVQQRAMKKCNVILNHTCHSYTIQVHGEGKDGEIVCYLYLEFGQESVVSTLLKPPVNFKTNHLSLYFTVIDGLTCQEMIFKAKSLAESMNWILAIHTSIYMAATLRRSPLSKSSFSMSINEMTNSINFDMSSEINEPDLNLTVEDIKIETQISPIKKPQIDNLESAKGLSFTIADSNKINESDNEDIERISNKKENLKQEKLDQEKTVALDNKVNEQRLIEIEKQRIEEEKQKENNLKRKIGLQKLDSLFSKAYKGINSNNKIEKPVERKSSLQNMVLPILDKDAVEFQIDKVLNMLDWSQEKITFNNFPVNDERTIDQIIYKTSNSNEETINLSEFIRLSDFPNFNFDSILKASTVRRPLVDKFTISLLGLEATDGQKIIEGPSTTKLCLTICALFLNGLKGFKSFNHKKKFLIALESLKELVDSLESIYDVVSQESTILTQVSTFVILLFNTQTFIPVIEAISREEEWVSKFYLPSSYIRDYETLQQILNMDEFIYSIDFDINVKSPILSSISAEEKARFIFKPAYSYRNLEFVKKNQDVEGIKSDIVDFFTNEINSAATIKPWKFMKELEKSSHVKVNCDFRLLRKSIQNAKKLSADKRIRSVFEDGVKFGLVHIWFILMITCTDITKHSFNDDSFFVDLSRAKHVLIVLIDIMKTYSIITC